MQQTFTMPVLPFFLLFLPIFSKSEQFSNISKLQLKITDSHPTIFTLDEATGTWYDCSCIATNLPTIHGPLFPETDCHFCKFFVHRSDVAALPSIFERFPNVKTLHLTYNYIEFFSSQNRFPLDADWLRGLPHLEALWIGGFNLTTDIFEKLPTVEKVEVFSSTLKRGRSSTPVERVKSLECNAVVFEPDSGVLGDFPNLRSLKVGGASSNFTVGEKWGENFAKLEFLEVQLRMKKLPENAFEGLKNLRELAIRTSTLERIEKGAFANQSKLWYLFLKNNYKLDLTGDEFRGLTELRELDVSFNNVTSLDARKIKEYLPKMKIFTIKNFYAQDSKAMVQRLLFIKELKKESPDFQIFY